jgi:anti-sigma B factor antagonist
MEPKLVQTSVTEVSGRSIVVVSGEVDQSSADEFKDALMQAVELSPRVIVDLGDLGFIDSSGLSALVAGFHAARSAGGTLVVANPAGIVRRLLELTNLDTALDVRPSVEDALASDDQSDG